MRKQQKLIRIADKSVDGWKVVDEYLSDDLASASEEDKRLRRARETVGQKRRQALHSAVRYVQKIAPVGLSCRNCFFRCFALILG